MIQIRVGSSYLSFLCYQYFAYFFHYSTLLDKILIFLNFLSCVLWPFLRIHFYMQVHKLRNTFGGIFRPPPSPFITPQCLLQHMVQMRHICTSYSGYINGYINGYIRLPSNLSADRLNGNNTPLQHYVIYEQPHM